MEIDTGASFSASVYADHGKIGRFTVPSNATCDNAVLRSREGIDYVNPGPSCFGLTVTANYLNSSGTGQLRSFVGPSFPIGASITADKIIGELFSGANGFSSSSCYGKVTIVGDVTSMVVMNNASAPGGAIPDFSIGGHLLQNFTMQGGQRGKILLQGNMGTTTVPRTMQLYTFTELQTANVHGAINFKAPIASSVPINLNGDVAGTLTFDQGLGNLVRIGGSVTGSGSGIRVLNANGLTGQVIVGANGVGGASISRTVEVGPSGSSVTLSPFPAYTQSSADIGGGAVGVPPFQLHQVDCKPLNPTTTPIDVSNVTAIRGSTWIATLDTISEQFMARCWSANRRIKMSILLCSG